eukprot:gnl/Spiro4/14148_TR7603_c0_g1_i1.p1 gnl/Spiro4/14148_TR7603_c0_g1~~gnl/Spiro4/14148_TR7603_c0_g1_i1.p1  ORF type:complete len:486 (+),score=161.53 gnl/Spiro4/14148_TR7603_c0_g1_i1:202-1659(+)
MVLGASGDLALKKTFPSLHELLRASLLPANTQIVGYARSAFEQDAFRAKVAERIRTGTPAEISGFLARISYQKGAYDAPLGYEEVARTLEARERQQAEAKGPQLHNRIFYFAIPPQVFVPVARNLKAILMSRSGWNRVIVEKPFGRDLDSSRALSADLKALFSEDQLFRIDHYLGKEMVQNLMVLRFANLVFQPQWNRNYINSVQITFKENIGTQGRGGYFDDFGIIRDVMQNHLLQLFSLVAMEPPVTRGAEDIRDEKVKVLRSTRVVNLEDMVLGQYTASPDGAEPGYLDDPTVPKGSLAATFAQAVLWVDNERWAGVPFLLKCGKALPERKAEIRIQFKDVCTNIFSGVFRNELIVRIQPNEAIYVKMMSKLPGLNSGVHQNELDMTLQQRYQGLVLPDAYERLILDVYNGDNTSFVRTDELDEAWRIFTPVLQRIERERVQPTLYPFGSRGPPAADEQLRRFYSRNEEYTWRVGAPPAPRA